MIDKNRLTTSDQMAFSITDFPVEPEEVRMSGDELNIILTQDGLDTVGTMIENGPDGNPITDYYTPRICKPLNGCPFCNVVNLP